MHQNSDQQSLRKQPCNTSRRYHWFPREMTSKEQLKNSILMTYQYLNLGSATDWLKQISFTAGPIRSTTQCRVVTPHQYGVYALFLQRSFRGAGVVKRRLFRRKWITPLPPDRISVRIFNKSCPNKVIHKSREIGNACIPKRPLFTSRVLCKMSLCTFFCCIRSLLLYINHTRRKKHTCWESCLLASW